MNYILHNGYQYFKNQFWIEFEKYSSENDLTLLVYASRLLTQYKDFKKKISEVNYDAADEEYVKFIIDGTKSTYEIKDGQLVFDLRGDARYQIATVLTKLELDKITEYLEGIIHNEKMNIYRKSGSRSKIGKLENEPENDFSDTLPLERLILAEKFGIISLVQSLQIDPDNIRHTAEILSSVTGINSSTIAKNLHVMLGKKKDDSDKNSPYKNPKNLQLANNKLNRMKIDVTKLL